MAAQKNMGTFSTQYSVITFTDMKPRLICNIKYIHNGYTTSKVLEPMAALKSFSFARLL
jgi:hypothetical protein